MEQVGWQDSSFRSGRSSAELGKRMFGEPGAHPLTMSGSGNGECPGDWPVLGALETLGYAKEVRRDVLRSGQ